MPAGLDAFCGRPHRRHSAANFNGSIDITVTASDGASTASDTFRLTFLAVNDAPTVQRIIPNFALPEDTAIDFTIPPPPSATSTATR
jgi:hypothetical protein